MYPIPSHIFILTTTTDYGLHTAVCVILHGHETRANKQLWNGLWMLSAPL